MNENKLPALKEILSVEEACVYLGVCKPVLLQSIKTQGLPCRRVGAKTLLFSRRALEQWIAAGTYEQKE